MFNSWKTLALGLAAFTAPMWAASTAQPGTLNYIEGQVSLNGQALTSRAVGSAEVPVGGVLETIRGKAEMLLTPGVFLRLGDDSAVRMDSPGLTNTRVALLRGKAMIEVAQLYKENNLQVADHGTVTTLIQKGVYGFNATAPQVAVYFGEALVREGDKQVKVKKGHELALNNASVKTAKFDRDVHDDLYNWSNIRSEYLSEAAAQSARTYLVSGGPWYGTGWYWNPWWGMYSFIPGNGFLYSPFGWGFYSPRFISYSPLYARGAIAPAAATRGFAGRGFSGGGFASHGVPGGGFVHGGFVHGGFVHGGSGRR